MKNELTYLQTHTMAYEILNHAHKFGMAKQLTTEILRIRTSLPFADDIFKGILYFICCHFISYGALCHYPHWFLSMIFNL